MTDKEAMNVASQCRATASADLCKNILVDGGSGFLFELLLDAAKAIETLAQEKALQALHDENDRLGLYKDAYAEQEPVACRTLCELCIKRGYNFCANAVKTTPITAQPAAQRTEEKK